MTETDGGNCSETNVTVTVSSLVVELGKRACIHGVREQQIPRKTK